MDNGRHGQRRILVAMDKFKGTLTATEAAAIVTEALRERLGASAAVEAWPRADGGEGTAELLPRARGGVWRSGTVRGPLGEPVEAHYGLSGRTAFLEMASASGLSLVPPARRRPLLTSTYGFGELMLAALAAGATSLVVGIGGSATNDGGAGMAEALGARFRDASGRELRGLTGGRLGEVASVEWEAVRRRLSGVSVTVAAEVRSPGNIFFAHAAPGTAAMHHCWRRVWRGCGGRGRGTRSHRVRRGVPATARRAAWGTAAGCSAARRSSRERSW